MFLLSISIAVAAQPSFTFLTAPHSAETEAYGINNNGQVVGYFQPPLNHWHGFIYDINTQTYTTLAVPGAPHTISTTIAFGINDSGSVVGGYIRMNNGVFHGYLRDSAGNYSAVTFPLQPRGLSQYPTGINNAGDVVGFYALPGANNRNGYLLQQGVFTPLSYPGSTDTVAQAINDGGTIVGWYIINTVVHGFMYANGIYSEVVIPGASLVEVLGINNLGDMVGFYEDASKAGHGFLIKQGNLQTIDCPGTGEYTYLYGINDADMFAGQCGTFGQTPQGFYGTP
jgi:probable HAF family extracellular repeat protein